MCNKFSRAIRPTHPGEMLREGFVVDYRLTVATLANALGASHARQSMNCFVNVVQSRLRSH
jgi:antitoxin HigA-1